MTPCDEGDSLRGRRRRTRSRALTPSELASRAHERIRLKGFPGPRDVWLLAIELRERVEVELADFARRPYSQVFSDGTALIKIPAVYSEERAAAALLEELGHFLLSYGDFPNEDRVLTDRQLRGIILAWEGREERRVREFVLAWKLSNCVGTGELDDEELAKESGCSLEEIQEYREMMLRWK
jgi:hypothetical protein